jgi:hypothetical protein
MEAAGDHEEGRATTPGKKLIPGMEDATTQDLLLIRTPTMPTRTPDEFVALVRAAQSPALLPFKLAGALGIGRAIGLVKKLAAGLSAPQQPLAATRYWSVLPMRWGDYAAKVSLVPRDAPLATIPKRTSPDALGEELAARLAEGPVIYDLRAQLYVDEARTPIEDPTVEWSEDVAPFATIATLTIPKQDPRSARGKRVAEQVEAMSFDPWHAPVEFRPLGAMMRARNHAYRLSTMERKAAKEPDGSELAESA